MPNPNQIGNFELNQNAENGFVKMANEMPSFEEHIKQYEATHPDAVKDIEKAHVMAKAGDELETKAANEKLSALNALDNGKNTYTSKNEIGNRSTKVLGKDYYKKSLSEAPSNIKALKEAAVKKENTAGQLYEDIKNS